MDKIRVLRIVSVMNRGGIESQIMNIYRKIDHSKIQFDFLVTREQNGLFDDEIRKLGGKIYYIPSIRKVGLLKFIAAVDVFFKNHKYKIIHSHMNTWSGLLLLLAKLNNIPIRIAHSHTSKGSLNGIPFKEKVFKKFMKSLIRFSSTDNWAVSDQAGEWLFGKGNYIKVVNTKEIEKYKFNSEERKKVRNDLKIDDKFVIGHIANFSEVKNHYFSLDVLKKLLSFNPNYILILIGDGDLKSKMEQKVIELNLQNNVIFLGSRNDVDKILNGLDLIILPSLFEGIPNVLLESQLNGLIGITSTNVSLEADLKINKLKYISLENDDDWVRKIEKIKKMKSETDRYVNPEKLTDYNINNQVKWLENHYLTIKEKGD